MPGKEEQEQGTFEIVVGPPPQVLDGSGGEPPSEPAPPAPAPQG